MRSSEVEGGAVAEEGSMSLVSNTLQRPCSNLPGKKASATSTLERLGGSLPSLFCSCQLGSVV